MIRCARCWKIILPGDPITLQEREDGLVPKNTVVFEGKAVCCCRKGCCGDQRKSGYWTKFGLETEFYNW